MGWAVIPLWGVGSVLFMEPFLLCGFSVLFIFTEPFLLCGFSVGISSFCSSEVSFFGSAEDLQLLLFFLTFEETGRTVANGYTMQLRDLFHSIGHGRALPSNIV